MKSKTTRCAMLTALMITAAQFAARAQAGPSVLTGPGIAFQADYLPSSHYIRPEDSLKMPANTAIRRYSAATAFNLRTRIDTATGKARIWNLALAGHYSQFSNHQYEKTIMPKELLGAGIALQHVRSINAKWSIMGVLSAGVYTDMEAIDFNDVFINGGVVFIKQQTPRFSYGFGAMLTNTFGAPMILPAVMVKWTTTGKFNIQAGIPEGVAASYRVSNFFETGLGVRINGGSYDVENKNVHQRLMAYQEITAGIENTFHINKRLSFSISGGSALLRNVTYREKSLADIFSVKPEHRLATGWYANAGIRMNFSR